MLPASWWYTLMCLCGSDSSVPGNLVKRCHLISSALNHIPQSLDSAGSGFLFCNKTYSLGFWSLIFQCFSLISSCTLLSWLKGGREDHPSLLRTLLRSHTALPLTSYWLEHSHMVVNFKRNTFFGWKIMDSAKKTKQNSGVLVTSILWNNTQNINSC